MIIILLQYNLYIALGDVAWDWVNQKVYWTDSCASDIEVYDPATMYRRVLFNSTNGVRNPSGMVIDPGTGYVHDVRMLKLGKFHVL